MGKTKKKNQKGPRKTGLSGYHRHNSPELLEATAFPKSGLKAKQIKRLLSRRRGDGEVRFLMHEDKRGVHGFSNGFRSGAGGRARVEKRPGDTRGDRGEH